MVNPIIPDFFRAQVVLQSRTALPEDSIVNTFGFRNDGVLSTNEMVSDVLDRITSFYNDIVAQTGLAVSNFLAGDLLLAPVLVKVYDLGQPPPRVVNDRTFNLNLNAGAVLPPEVAVTASFYGTRNLPRQRGRVFLGPLRASTLETVANRVRVTEAARTTIAHAMRRLSQGLVNNGADWSVISPTGVTGYNVTAGWVDDAPDTQRRRGTEASVRTTWDEAGVV